MDFSDVCKRLDANPLSPLAPHMRHFHATALVAGGVDARTVADRLGHSSVSFMLSTYAHAVARAQEQAAAVANESLTKMGRSAG